MELAMLRRDVPAHTRRSPPRAQRRMEMASTAIIAVLLALLTLSPVTALMMPDQNLGDVLWASAPLLLVLLATAVNGFQYLVQSVSFLLAGVSGFGRGKDRKERIESFLEGFVAAHPYLLEREVEIKIDIKFDGSLPCLIAKYSGFDGVNPANNIRGEVPNEYVEALVWIATGNGNAYKLSSFSTIAQAYYIDLRGISAHEQFKLVKQAEQEMQILRDR